MVVHLWPSKRVSRMLNVLSKYSGTQSRTQELITHHKFYLGDYDAEVKMFFKFLEESKNYKSNRIK